MASINYPLTPQCEHALRQAAHLAVRLRHIYIGSEHLLLGLIRTECLAAYIIKKHEVTEEKLLGLIDRLVAPESDEKPVLPPQFTPKALEILEAAWQDSASSRQEKLGTEQLAAALLRSNDNVAVRLFHTMDIQPRQILADLADAMGEDGDIYQPLTENRGGSHASVLEQYSKDLTEQAAAGMLDPVVGREKELDRLLRILNRRTKNNPCLIGEPGVGKTAIVEKLAQRMAEGSVPERLRGCRLLVLDLPGMVAGTKYRGEFEERIKNVIAEAEASDKILLFLDEIHTLIGAGGAEGSLDAANILKPALSRGALQLIGATTVTEYRRHIEKDAALERRFQPVTVAEPSEEETVEILCGLRSRYEAHHGVDITDEALAAAARLSARYIQDRYLPDKALDLLDEAAARASMLREDSGRSRERIAELEQLEQEKALAVRTGDFARAARLRQEQQEKQKKLLRRERSNHVRPAVTEDAVAEIVADWTKIPVKSLTEAESVRLRQLEKLLHRRVIGQEEAVSAVSRAVRRSRVGLKDPRRPIGSFLFLGPTGVGKTELAKALAQAMFGREDAIIRVDMSEYMEKHSVSKLIGSPPGYVGYEEGGQFSERVRRKPYSVVLFDEIEKAHPDVFHLLLQVLDDGHITDSQGRQVDFKNTILIMTSNVGAERIMTPKKLGFSAEQGEQADDKRMQTQVMEEVRKTFRPEFLNRIDEILVFHALNEEELKQILSLMLREIIERTKASMGITLRVTGAARAWLLSQGSDRKYGARPLRRALQTHVEDALAEEILAGRLKPGTTVTLSCTKNQLKFSGAD